MNPDLTEQLSDWRTEETGEGQNIQTPFFTRGNLWALGPSRLIVSTAILYSSGPPEGGGLLAYVHVGVQEQRGRQ